MSLFRRRLLLNAGNTLSNSLIARYTCYDKTNEDEDRDVLKDLSGNGYDIQLYNFAFFGSSGYGEYPNMEPTSGNQIVDKSKKNIGLYTLLNTQSGHGIVNYSYPKNIVNWKVNISNIPEGVNCIFSFRGVKQTLNEGLNIINAIGMEEAVNKNPIISFSKTIAESEMEPIVIQFEADYKGALVADGIDDYGVCDKFPILYKESGYTVLALRKYISKTNPGYFIVCNGVDEFNCAFSFEYLNTGLGERYSNFVSVSAITFGHFFNFSTSKQYNKVKMGVGTKVPEYSNLNIFASKNKCTNVALYALEIYNRDLSDKEIEERKARMIAEYEEKTGEKYTEETT